MLVSLVSSYRYDGEHVDMDVAKLEAPRLSEAIREKQQLDRNEVVRIISTRSKSQLAATFQQYKEDQGRDIVEVGDEITELNAMQLVKLKSSGVLVSSVVRFVSDLARVPHFRTSTASATTSSAGCLREPSGA